VAIRPTLATVRRVAKVGHPTLYQWQSALAGVDEGCVALAADDDDEVLGFDVADVAEGVHGLGGDEDDSSGADVLGFAVVLEGDGAFADEDDVGLAMLVGGVGDAAGEGGGAMDLDGLAGSEDAVKDGAGLAAVGILPYGEFVVGEDPGGIEDGFAGCGRGRHGLDDLALGGGHGGDGGESNQEVAAIDVGHGGHVRRSRIGPTSAFLWLWVGAGAKAMIER
jgi:hypothetical protein